MATAVIRLAYPTSMEDTLNVSSTLPKEMVDEIRNRLEGAVAGDYADTNGVAATGTATLSSVIATDIIVVAGVTFTGIASGATSVQFNIGSDDTATAVNIVNAINNHPTTSKLVIASSAAAVITITSLEKSASGNSITLSTTDTTITFSASTLKGGLDAVLLQVSRNETSGVKASGTAIFTAVVATDKLTIAGVDFECVASGATGSQFNKGATEAASAVACAAKINANATTSKYVVATTSYATITITAIEKSALGNLVTLAETGGHMTLSAAALAGGVAVAFTTYAI